MLKSWKEWQGRKNVSHPRDYIMSNFEKPNHMIFSSTGRVHLICVHHCRHFDLSWSWHVQPVEKWKGTVCCRFGNVLLGSRKLPLPSLTLWNNRKIERVSLLLKAGVLASPFLLSIRCFLAVVSVDESLDFITFLNTFSWNVGIVSFASLKFTFLVGCGIDEWLQTLRSFQLMSTSGSKQVETKQFHPRCADMLCKQFTHASMSKHEYAHGQTNDTPVNYTKICSAKPHGLILFGWRGSDSHLDVGGAGVSAACYTRCTDVWPTWWCDIFDFFCVSFAFFRVHAILS